MLLLIVIGIGLVFIPWEYRVEGEGRLMPVVQADVFAPWDGVVVQIEVESGQRVEKDQVLLRLRNRELDQHLVGAETDLAAKEAVLASLVGQARRTLEQTEKDKLYGQHQQTKAEIEGLLKQTEVLEERARSLIVKAPKSGIVTTFQIEQLLLHRPVKRGEVLIEIKDDTGEWRLELDVKEQRVGHLLNAQKAKGSHDLDVEFVLATDSETTYYGKLLKEMSPRTNPSEDKGSVIVVFAEFDKTALPRARIGAEVRAKISCGQKSLGYVLFGDVVEFLYKYLWLSDMDG